MDLTIWAAVIGAVASVLVFVAGGVASTLKDRAADRQMAISDARLAVQELLRAALDVKATLAVWEARWKDKRAIAGALGHSVAQILAGFAEDRAFRGMAEALGSSMAWRRAADTAEEAVVTGPMSRMAAAAARIAMLDDPELRAAATAVTDALGTLVGTYSEKPTSPARRRAETEVDEACGGLAAAGRAYDGRPRAS